MSTPVSSAQAFNTIVLKAIKEGRTSAKLIAADPRCKMALEHEATRTGREKMRILDGALQALRRKGYIEYRRGAWLSKYSLDL